jgi:hypothetical protein
MTLEIFVTLVALSLVVGAPIVWLIMHPRALMWLAICGAVGFVALAALVWFFQGAAP